MTAELALDAERARRLAIPVGQEREVQVERLRPGDVRPRGVTRDAGLLELRAPVTQELQLARSGRGPVEEVEDEESPAVAEHL
jgi:hypothetical protein